MTGRYTHWTEAEKAVLREMYFAEPWDAICAAIPLHSKCSIAKMANEMGLTRDKARRNSPYPIIREMRQIRRAKRLRQDILAEELGAHCVQIAKWERGELVPRFRSFLDWVEALGYELRLHPRATAVK